jgi:methylated-DNA-[protein]-cysteine S-methyltransferase
MRRFTFGTAAQQVVDDMKMLQAPYYSELDSPVGTLLLVGDDSSLQGLYMDPQKYRPALAAGCERHEKAFRSVREQLQAYFAGRLRRFEVTLAGEGSAFQKEVWRALLEIPFGQTESYGQLARRIGRDKASRAVGLANGRNPIGIIVPCHRVVGANGSLTGYGGGIERKKWLLEHERRSS